MLLRSFLMLLSLLWLFFGIASSASATKADPAITHANAIRHGNIAYKEGYFGAGDARLHYVVAGKGPLIILYHGFPSFWYCWFDQMEALKTQYRVVAVDALGAGLSAKPTAQNAYRIEKLAAQIDGLARHLNGGKRFTLIGHDWGAALAFSYAQAYPDRLNTVIGISAPPYNQFLDLVRTNAEQRTRSNYMQVFHQLSLAGLTASGLPQRLWEQSYLSLISNGDLSPEEGELFRKALADPYAINGGMNWYRANIPLFATISKRDYWPAANPTIKVPTLVISGSADMIFVSDFLLHINDYAPGAKIVTLPNINHWATIEKSTFATGTITQFLKGNHRSAATQWHD